MRYGRAAAGQRQEVALACTVCEARNYRTTRPARAEVKILELKKFCTTCKHHTLHRETK